MKFRNYLTGALTVTVLLASPLSIAKEVVLRAVTAFQPGSMMSVPFERFVDKVNEEGKGLVQIQLLGGPSSMPPFEVGNAVMSGVIDIGYATSAYYSNLMPEATALRLAELPMAELRRNGGWELINELHNKKVNAWYLARTGEGTAYHLYINKPIDKADLSGLNLRTTPNYRAFFEALGASNIQTPPSEVYTAMERGVVDGYGWPMQGLLDLGWHEVTKARVEPGFYQLEISTLVNLDKWNALTQEQRDFLSKMGLYQESLNTENSAIDAAEAKKQADAGIVVYELTGAEREKWTKAASDAGWAELRQIAPDEADKLYELLVRH